MTSVDLVLRDATILDGSGAVPFRGDLAISGDRIIAVGVVPGGRRELDVQGRAVAPGFVDTHTHDDAALLRYPRMEFKLSQGCTSVVIGNCGFSAAPATPGSEPVPGNASLFSGLEPEWTDLHGYFGAVKQRKPSLNCLALTGHNTLRWLVMGGEARPPRPAELERMRGLLERSLDQGAAGLSSGLIYRPGKYAETEELIQMAEPLRDRGALYATHLRNEGDRLLEAVDEAIRIGREAAVPVHISHHKAAGRKNWGRVGESLARVDQENRSGGDITLDMYPYTMGSGPMVEYFNLEAIDLELARVMRLAKCPAFPELEGRALVEIAESSGVGLADLVRKILTSELGPQTICIQLLVDEADLETNLRHPRMMVGSDGIADLEGKPHPRLFGTMPRILAEFVRKRRVLPLPEAIRRITHLACQRFGLAERGLVREGYFADLVVFDPERIEDRATYEDPKRFATGVEAVIVNGQLAYWQGAETGAGAGRPLRHRKAA